MCYCLMLDKNVSNFIFYWTIRLVLTYLYLFAFSQRFGFPSRQFLREMTKKLRRYALCVGVAEDTGACFMVYENDLNAVEVRAEFAGAQTGKWYRYEMGKGARRWEAAEERLLTRTVTRRNNTGDGGTTRQLIQIGLPIFFVPNFKCFGCAWRVAPPAELCDKMQFNFFSPHLESAGKINFSVKQLVELNVRPGEQCFAFLTLEFQTLKSAITPPQWALDAAEDLQMITVGPLSSVSASSNQSASLGTPKKWGILVDLIIDANDGRSGTGAILCIHDGKLAFGRVLRDGGITDCWRAQVGDIVGFNSIDVDCFNHSVRMALNVLAFVSVDSNLSDQFPQEALPDLPSVRLITKSAGKVGQHTFELAFVIDDARMFGLRMGSFRVDRLGVLIDLNGELLSAWNNMTRSGADPISVLLARVKARLCLTPEQQQPLWVMDEIFEISKIRSDTWQKQRTQNGQQQSMGTNSEMFDEGDNKLENGRSSNEAYLQEQSSELTVQNDQLLTGINCETSEAHNKLEDGRSSTEAYLQEQSSEITVPEGAFGLSVASKRCKNYQIRQQQIPRVEKTAPPIKRSAPVPVTNVFMRQNDGAASKQQPSNNLLPTLSNFKARFLQTQTVGIVVYVYASEDNVSFYEYEVWPFCTGRTSPRELLFRSSQRRLQIGQWLKFPKEDYEQNRIDEENCHGLVPWMATETDGKNVYIDCVISVPSDFGVNSEAELSTTVHEPTEKTPFIRRLKVDEFLLPRLSTHLRGSECKVRIKYESKICPKKGPQGYWRITQIHQ